MKKFTILMVVAALFSTVAIAQENRFSAGLELALPMGDFADAAGFGFGASLRYEIPLGEQLGFIPTIGVLSFGGEELEIPNVYKIKTSNLMFPIQVGLKYYFMEAQDGFYAALQTGVHIVSSKVETTIPAHTDIDLITGQVINVPESKSEVSGSDTNFGIAPGIGFHLPNVDIGLRYQLLFAKAQTINPVTFEIKEETVTNSYIGIRIAYVFGG